MTKLSACYSMRSFQFNGLAAPNLTNCPILINSEIKGKWNPKAEHHSKNSSCLDSKMQPSIKIN